jgi:CRP-like cAMP-binding protein
MPQPAVAAMPDRLFPTLTSEQISRISAHGRWRTTTAGEVLVDVGDNVIPFFVVLSGAIQALRLFDGVDALNATLRAGQFSDVTATTAHSSSIFLKHVFYWRRFRVGTCRASRTAELRTVVGRRWPCRTIVGRLASDRIDLNLC